MTGLGGIILAGGASRRMGSDKAVLDWNGRRAVDRLADLARLVGCRWVLSAGADHGFEFVPDPAVKGPVAGILAGMAALKGRGLDRALILAVDAPTLRPADLAPLLAEPGPGATYEGLPLPMVIALDAVPALADGDWSMFRLVEWAKLRTLACDPETRLRVRGANTPQEREVLLEQLRTQEP